MFKLLANIFKIKSHKQDLDKDIKVTVHGKGLFVVDLDSLMNNPKVKEQVSYISEAK